MADECAEREQEIRACRDDGERIEIKARDVRE